MTKPCVNVLAVVIKRVKNSANGNVIFGTVYCATKNGPTDLAVDGFRLFVDTWNVDCQHS
jgi:hypothetical protein